MLDGAGVLRSVTVYTLSFKRVSPNDLAVLRSRCKDVYQTLCSNGIYCTVLSTCLRFEVYVHTENQNFVEEYLKNFFGRYWSYTDRYSGIDAVRYLFEVSSGLHSQVVGEWEILEQVEHASTISAKYSCGSWLLEEIFRKAVDVGRKVRSYGIGLDLRYRGYPQLAVEILSKTLDGLNDRKIMAVGSGHAIRRAVRYIMKNYRPSVVTVFDTDYRKASNVCETYGESCIAVPHDELAQWLSKIDGIIVAVHSIEEQYLSRIKQSTRDMKIPIVDLSIPPLLEKLHERVYTFSDIQKYAEELSVSIDLDRVRRIIDEEVEVFLLYIARRLMNSRISSLMKVVEMLSLYSAEKLSRELGIDGEAKGIVVVAFRNHVHKVLTPLIDVMLKKSIHNPNFRECMDAILMYLENVYAMYIDGVK